MGKQQIWKLADLPLLMTGDRLAFRAEGWQRPVIAVIGAKTWHWAFVGEPLVDNELSQGDWSVEDSTSKGTTSHLLSEYQYRHMRIYRPELSDGQQESEARYLLKWCKYYGVCKYDMAGVFHLALWCILRKLGIKVKWWERNDRFWCLEYLDQVNRDLDHQVVPDDEPAYPTNFERNKTHKLIWGTF